MSEQQTVQQGEWTALSLRLTAFTGPGEKISGEEWWAGLTGHSPETQIKRKLGFQEVGEFGPGRLVLTIEPSRIDWRLLPPARTEDTEDEIPAIGEFPAILSLFVPLMAKWLQDYSPSLRRLAFGTELAIPVTSSSEAIERLIPYLRDSVFLDPQVSQDFVYQINKPRPTQKGIPNLIINRLSKWSVKYLAIGSLSMGQTIEISNLGIPFGGLELDINTAIEFGDTLPHGELTHIFDELATMGAEIATKGDIS